jgi:hypothetical protein
MNQRWRVLTWSSAAAYFQGIMSARSFSSLLVPLAWAVLIGGWVLAIAAFLAIGTESCTQVAVPVAGSIEACQDTTAGAVIMLTVIGFVATVGSLFLWGLRHLLNVLADIEEHTR